MEKNLHESNIRMLHAVLNKFWNRHAKKELLYDQLTPISQTIPGEQDMWDTAGDVRTN